MRPNQSLYSKILLASIALCAVLMIVIGGVLSGWDFAFLISEQAQAVYAILAALVLVYVAMWLYKRYGH